MLFLASMSCCRASAIWAAFDVPSLRFASPDDANAATPAPLTMTATDAAIASFLTFFIVRSLSLAFTLDLAVDLAVTGISTGPAVVGPAPAVQGVGTVAPGQVIRLPSRGAVVPGSAVDLVISVLTEDRVLVVLAVEVRVVGDSPCCWE